MMGSFALYGATIARCGRGFRQTWKACVVILESWVLGFSFHVATGLIHFLLVPSLIIFVFNLIPGDSARSEEALA
jgi:hypothetical protein